MIIAPTTPRTQENPLPGLQVHITVLPFIDALVLFLIQFAPGIFSVTSIVAANRSPLMRKREVVSKREISIFFIIRQFKEELDRSGRYILREV